MADLDAIRERLAGDMRDHRHAGTFGSHPGTVPEWCPHCYHLRDKSDLLAEIDRLTKAQCPMVCETCRHQQRSYEDLGPFAVCGRFEPHLVTCREMGGGCHRWEAK